ELLDTVTNLTEDPKCLLGSFKPGYLALPRELLVTTMKNHQKYFSVVGADGRLLPHFVVAINTRVFDPAVVARGNERVLSARLADAEFFWSSDSKKPLASFRERLGERVFLKGLGNISDKVERIVALSRRIAETVGFADLASVERAALLCKCDLASEMVGEFPELQGIMGREYASKQGETPAVSAAIFEHYLPRGASDDLPSGDIGAIVGLADRVDSVIGCFSLGMSVSGTQDPYALRRQVLGVMRVLLDRGYEIGLSTLFSLALDEYASSDFRRLEPRAEVLEVAMGFARDRFKHLQAETFPVDVIDAVLEARFDRVDDALARIRALAELRSKPEFEPLAIAWKRMANITRKNPPAKTAVETSVLQHDSERALYDVGARVRAEVIGHLEQNDYRNALLTMITLKPVVDRFFDDVLVMDPDPAVRENRLALLAEVQSIFGDIANFTAIQT
ncbi:MAG: glycine--tRNA ligase subunit beta, partial [Myxococcales bacterium]|nr:glycine--tRNA ligase subunit beta [Myxococcales bacterium]